MNILNLPAWRVLDVQEKAHQYLILAEPEVINYGVPISTFLQNYERGEF